MKKTLTVLFIISAVSISPLFLTSAEKTPVDFVKLNKAILLFKESASLYNDNKSVKSEKKRNEAHKITDTLFQPGKTITADKNCYIQKSGHNQNTFELSCASGKLEEGGKLTFVFNTMYDQMGGDKKNLTSKAVLEEYEEDAPGFTGKIQFLQGKEFYTTKHAVAIYDPGSEHIPLEIHCRIVSLKKIKEAIEE